MWFSGKWAQLEMIKLSKLKQSEKDKCHRFPFICGSYVLHRYMKSHVYMT